MPSLLRNHVNEKLVRDEVVSSMTGTDLACLLAARTQKAAQVKAMMSS